MSSAVATLTDEDSAPLIITVTPNPSLDLLFTAERMVWDDANRVPGPRRRPGGQGINVVRAVRALSPGTGATAVAALGGRVGAELEEALRAEATPVRAVAVEGETRVFVGVRERGSGRSLMLNPRGPDGDEGLADALLDAATHELTDRPRGPSSSTWVAGCGSLLPGLPSDFYVRLGRVARAHGARYVPDCDGEALERAAGSADLLVPNAMEAERLAGRPVTGRSEAIVAARALLEWGPDRVVITLGAGGAISVDGSGAWVAVPEAPEPLAAALATGSTVGAGDVFLAALLSAPGGGTVGAAPDDLSAAVAAGTAALLGEGASLVRAADVERIRPHVRLERLTG